MHRAALLIIASLGFATVAGAQQSATHEIYAQVDGRILDTAHAKHASIWLNAVAQNGTATIDLRIPLASTEDVYGESRGTSGGPAPKLILFTGLDEKNFARFEQSSSPRHFRFLLNKSLCRAMAAPFHAGAADIQLDRNMAHWRFTSLSIETTGAAPVRSSFEAHFAPTNSPFDYAQCAVIAPSSGLCCVAHRQTEWHCGEPPAGEGWHPVSGSCFHRETGAGCTE